MRRLRITWSGDSKQRVILYEQNIYINRRVERDKEFFILRVDGAQKKKIGLSLGIPGAVTGVVGIREFCLKLSNIFKKHQLDNVSQKIKPISDNIYKYLDKQPKSNIGNGTKNHYGIRN